MQIRRATPADAPAIAELFIAARGQMTYLPTLHSDDETRAFIAHVVATQEVWITVTKEDRVTGFAAINDEDENIFLDHLYIAPFAQRLGLGAALLTHVKTQRPQGFSLWTFEQNQGAQRFYETHGLSLARKTDGRDNEEKRADCLYVWRGNE
ncbi:MAG: GNAT family N-acetyltransferase [Parvibaculum sp.]|nr:GNAT family N-acetyltransferase [Parvibaculum sp.]